MTVEISLLRPHSRVFKQTNIYVFMFCIICFGGDQSEPWKGGVGHKTLSYLIFIGVYTYKYGGHETSNWLGLSPWWKDFFWFFLYFLWRELFFLEKNIKQTFVFSYDEVCHPNSPSTPGLCVCERVSQLTSDRVYSSFDSESIHFGSESTMRVVLVLVIKTILYTQCCPTW